MSPRFASATTSSPAVRAYAHTRSKTSMPGAPSASKKAICTFTPTTYGATASTIAQQNRSIAPRGVRPAAQLDRQQLDARVEPDQQLRLLAVDGFGDAVAERNGRDGRPCQRVLRHHGTVVRGRGRRGTGSPPARYP